MDKDKETEEKKLPDLTPEKDAKGGAPTKPLPYPPGHLPPIDPPETFPPGARPKLS